MNSELFRELIMMQVSLVLDIHALYSCFLLHFFAGNDYLSLCDNKLLTEDHN